MRFFLGALRVKFTNVKILGRTCEEVLFETCRSVVRPTSECSSMSTASWNCFVLIYIERILGECLLISS